MSNKKREVIILKIKNMIDEVIKDKTTYFLDDKFTIDAPVKAVPEEFKILYANINIDIDGIEYLLSYYHYRINHLFDFMNGKTNYHFNADESRELLGIIKGIEKLIEMLKAVGYSMELIQYVDEMKYVETFLKPSHGSPIPRNYRIKLCEYEPIFGVSGGSQIVDVQNIDKITHEFAKEQIKKCRKRIADGDYDGAITSSRALIESVIKELYQNITGNDIESKGDLTRDWNNLTQVLNLHAKKAPADSLKQVLTGLTSIIQGLSAMRNKMSDSHGREKSYKPEKHHAVLAVNCSITATDFLFDTYEYQIKEGLIKPSQKD